jgi:GT2 family glycosyltransferase/glycosyltransferase involved in cell wall biosynthesis
LSTLENKTALSEAHQSLPHFLWITHAMGGGVERHVADLRQLLADSALVDVLRPAGVGIVRLELAAGGEEILSAASWPRLVEALSSRGYSRLHYHQIDGHAQQVLDLPALLALAYDVTLHDYFPYCPVYNLSTIDGGYCGEPDLAGCEQCQKVRPHAWGLSVPAWRARMHALLAQADRVLAPSHFVADRVRGHFPDVPIRVQAHPPRAEWLAAPVHCARVVLLGELSRLKGLEVLRRCAESAQANSLPLEFTLLGAPEQAIAQTPELPIQLRGPYSDAELPQRLTLERADVIWFPGSYPETYAYTLDVALASGLPIVACNWGALPERLANHPDVILLPSGSSPEAWNQALLKAVRPKHPAPGDLEPWPDQQVQRALRLSYRDMLLAPLAGVEVKRTVNLLPDFEPLRAVLPPNVNLPLLELYSYGVVCGHRQAREVLRQRLEEADRDQALLQRVALATGKPWWVALNTYIEVLDGLRAEIAQAHAETAQAHAEIAQAHAETAQAHAETAQAHAETAQAHAETAQAHAETAQAREQTVLEQQRTRLAEQATEAQVQAYRQLDELFDLRGQDLVRSQARIEELERSTSWRITRPVRQLGAFIQRSKLRVAKTRQLAVRAIDRAPMMLSILRSEGPVALVRRIQSKVNAPVHQAAQRPAPAQSEISPLVLATCPAYQSPRYSIVIPVYEQHLYTFNCLKSLGEQTDLSDVEVIVVDDASPSAAAQALACVQGVRIVRNPQNLGFIGSCHHGADLARGDILVMLNNDTQVTSGWLQALQWVFDARADAGLVGAKLVYPNGTLQEAGGILWQDGSAWNWGRGDDPDRPIYNYLREADYCSGACLAIRRRDWLALGGFDRAYTPAYYEDTDLAFRVRAAGQRVYYQPQCTVVHYEGISSGTDETQGVKRHQVINREVFFKRWEGVLKAHRPNGVAPQREVDRRAHARVLIVEACMITPDQDSGSVRLLAMLELLVAQGHKVSFVADNLECRQPYVSQLQRLGVEVWFGPYVESVAQLLEQRGELYDTIFFCRHYIAAPYMARIRQWAGQARIVFDTVDLHYLREQRLAELENSPAMMATAQKTREQELGVIRACDVTLVVSPVEQGILSTEVPGADVRVLSNIHEPEPVGPGYTQREGLLFIGGFRHPPNIDAVEWFLAEVWPLVRARLPQLVFTVVGSHMPVHLKALSGPGVNILGYVEDVNPLLARARISVAPLRYGAGVKGKVNQAMAHGLPVVATGVASEGMGLRPGIDLLVADEPQAYADEIVRLYGDEALWLSLAANGRANIEQHFSRANAARTLAELVAPRTPR